MYYGLIHYFDPPDKVTHIQWFDHQPTHPMEFDVIESCYDPDAEWKIVECDVKIKS